MKKLLIKSVLLIAVVAGSVAVATVSFSQGGNVDMELARTKLLSCYGEPTYVDELLKSDYLDWNMDWDDQVKKYHATVNAKFNDYIKMLLNDIKSGKDLRSLTNNTPVKNLDGSPGECGPDNYSTYCVASSLYSDPAFGYKNFRDIMSCRKFDLYKSALEEKEWYRWLETDYCVGNTKYGVLPCSQEEKEQLTKKFGSVDLALRALDVSEKVTEVDEQIAIAKQALDTTLATYDQLKTAWELHIRYIGIYESLTIFRDKISQIRMPVETYSSKFTDATTASCT